MNRTSDIELIVSSNEISLNEIDEFLIGVKITNKSKEIISFDISSIELFVNGIKSIAWNLTVQNGTLINLKIKSNGIETIKWPLGRAIFESLGIYELKLVWKSNILKQYVTVSE